MCVCVCVCVCVFSAWQKLCEYTRRVTDLQPTGLAFGLSKTWFLLGYKSSHTCESQTIGKVR